VRGGQDEIAGQGVPAAVDVAVGIDDGDESAQVGVIHHIPIMASGGLWDGRVGDM
jgi:hypothetical protein